MKYDGVIYTAATPRVLYCGFLYTNAARAEDL